MKRTRYVALLLTLLFLAGGCASEEEKSLTLTEAAIAIAGGAQRIVDDVVADEHRAGMAKAALVRVELIVADHYRQTIAHRDELFHRSADPEASPAELRGILASLRRARAETRERMIDEWLLARAWMTPEEWVEFNRKVQDDMGVEAP